LTKGASTLPQLDWTDLVSAQSLLAFKGTFSTNTLDRTMSIYSVGLGKTRSKTNKMKNT